MSHKWQSLPTHGDDGGDDITQSLLGHGYERSHNVIEYHTQYDQKSQYEHSTTLGKEKSEVAISMNPNETYELENNIKMYYASMDTVTSEAITNREYKYQSNFDSNGILYAIGINFDFNGNNEWINPAENEKVILKSYPDKMSEGSLSYIVGRHGTNCELDSQYTKNASFAINFVGLKICPTYYTLRHGYKYHYGYLKSWNLEAMNENKEWICLDKKINNSELKGKYKCVSWPITNNTNYYA
eukprot:46709_1